MLSGYAKEKEVIVGAGIIGALNAYFIYKEAEQSGKGMPRVTVYDKAKRGGSTAENIAPSLTPDEALAVIPPQEQLLGKLAELFKDEVTGIGVDDVPNTTTASAAKKFIEEVGAAGQQKSEMLLALGTLSMKMWEELYTEGDAEFKKILEESNFHPCVEPENTELGLGKGYRVDLIYGVEDPQKKAQGMIDTYASLGYRQCEILSPQEVEELDPSLTAFCKRHTEENKQERQWKKNAIALYRPGGCIDVNLFLPKLYQYLEERMGTYKNEEGNEKSRFRVKYERDVSELVFSKGNDHVDALKFADRQAAKSNKRYSVCDYVICPWESVETLEKLGLQSPAAVKFAGASLKLNVPLNKMPEDLKARYAGLSQWMEVHTDGIVLAWQAKVMNDVLCVRVAGTKAFYGVEKPEMGQDFQKVANLRQLKVLQEVIPDVICFVLDKEGEVTEEDLNDLLQNGKKERGMATCWVGSRAAAYDGNPTSGPMFKKGEEKALDNVYGITHAGSGGVSLAPGFVAYSRLAREKTIVASDERKAELQQLTEKNDAAAQMSTRRTTLKA